MIVHRPLILAVQAEHLDVEVGRNVGRVLAVCITDRITSRAPGNQAVGIEELVHPERALREVVEDVREIEPPAECQRVRAARNRKVVDRLENRLLEQVARRELLRAERDRASWTDEARAGSDGAGIELDANGDLRCLHGHDTLVLDRVVAHDQLVRHAAREVGIQLRRRGVVLRVALKGVAAEAEARADRPRALNRRIGAEVADAS